MDEPKPKRQHIYYNRRDNIDGRKRRSSVKKHKAQKHKARHFAAPTTLLELYSSLNEKSLIDTNKGSFWLHDIFKQTSKKDTMDAAQQEPSTSSQGSYNPGIAAAPRDKKDDTAASDSVLANLKRMYNSHQQKVVDDKKRDQDHTDEMMELMGELALM
ncbi:hypothetical protein BDB00DRAFT_879419 [Zychaea mexicana]|uniref:uncharacterized protein n=1 Tax=Zychaea mexicana TaxID=64656 RepID=UPI0022FE4740|nr:uncharacterized protein BDB00DRAFT_879419 [Zychaea mexicana]KAI9477151.1 hypothetical protein BDB00DRAFT_879419 [Zychaea mexicana]